MSVEGEDNEGVPSPATERQSDDIETVQTAPSIATGPNTYRDGNLGLVEMDWRDRFERLKAKGYLLRPRFRPGWQPSRVPDSLDRYLAEDFLAHRERHRCYVHEGQFFRGVKTDSFRRNFRGISNWHVLHHLNTPRDPRNHCVPILDSFEIDDDDSIYIVMPLLRDFDEPNFYSVREVIDFVHQTLEGTKFMHDHLVAHRDLSTYNIMMDGTPLYPNGFHPSHQNRTVSGTALQKGRTRLHSAPVFYYLIDFGLSTKYDGDGPHEAIGIDGQDRDAPELERLATGPYDPFLLDIFTLGNVYKKSLLDNYINLDFLRPLVERMTQRTPKDRPTISEAIAMFEPIYAARKRPSFRRRLHPPEEGPLQRNVLDIFASLQDTKYMTSYIFTYWYRALTFRRPWKT
ncbi:hypothetical protein SCHPADRAFT_940067 [Schizopora paradoxa]|uniref:Protein kinase domain-containing protein n=1 Tax=Schizopora paradoxa TaxID=27342 RepID=A0A0H2RQG0_9AGAM|nr:hypothetical protein SCHPADRAFT_940067 [Schizopora paradoxa]